MLDNGAFSLWRAGQRRPAWNSYIAGSRPGETIQASLLNEQAGRERTTGGRHSSARNGVFRQTCQRVLESLGWRWIPTMKIGAGCRVHLKAAELPAGRLIVRCSKHTTAVIDGIIHDTYDPSRAGTRCVYGYFTKAKE